MSNNASNDNIIETVDEHGQHVKFELVDIVEVDEVEYGLLYPVEGFDPEHPDKPGDKVIIMRLKRMETISSLKKSKMMKNLKKSQITLQKLLKLNLQLTLRMKKINQSF